MEKRKIIAFGSSSYIVSLPKSWINSNNLKKGDHIHIEDKKSELVLYPGERTSKTEPKSIVIDTDNKDIDMIQTIIVSSYLNGYDMMYIKGDKVGRHGPKLKSIIRGLTGLEIIQQDADKITAKDLLNIKEINMTTLIRRIDNIVRSMMIECIECSDEETYESLVERDNDLNRLAFLAIRVMKAALKDGSLAKSISMTNCEILMNWSVVRRLEKIGDQTKRIARHMRKVTISKKERDKIKNMYSHIYQDYIDVMNAYYKKEKETAYLIDNSNRKRINMCKDYVDSIEKSFENDKDTVNIARAIDHMTSLRTEIKCVARAVMGFDG